MPMGMGKYIPLGQVATISREIGPDEIDSDNGQLRVFVQANVEGRDLGGFVKEAQMRIAKEIQLPPGMTIEWSGQYEDQIRAEHTLLMIVPTALFIISFCCSTSSITVSRKLRTSSLQCRSR